MPLVFVYGTLCEGYGNHDLLGDSLYLGNAVTVDKFAVNGQGFPIAWRDQPDNISFPLLGEVYFVQDPDVLDRLDSLEGHPDWYQRELRDVHLYDDLTGDYTYPLKIEMYTMERKERVSDCLSPSGKDKYTKWIKSERISTEFSMKEWLQKSAEICSNSGFQSCSFTYCNLNHFFIKLHYLMLIENNGIVSYRNFMNKSLNGYTVNINPFHSRDKGRINHKAYSSWDFIIGQYPSPEFSPSKYSPLYTKEIHPFFNLYEPGSDHPCHGKVDQNIFRKGCPYLVSSYKSQIDNPKINLSFLDWLVNKSFWHRIFITKNLDEITKYGFLIDTDFPPNYMLGGLQASRQPYQDNRVVRRWYSLTQLGIDPSLSYYLTIAGHVVNDEHNRVTNIVGIKQTDEEEIDRKIKADYVYTISHSECPLSPLYFTPNSIKYFCDEEADFEGLFEENNRKIHESLKEGGQYTRGEAHCQRIFQKHSNSPLLIDKLIKFLYNNSDDYEITEPSLWEETVGHKFNRYFFKIPNERYVKHVNTFFKKYMK